MRPQTFKVITAPFNFQKQSILSRLRRAKQHILYLRSRRKAASLCPSNVLL